MVDIENIAKVIAEQLQELGFSQGMHQARLEIARNMQAKGFDQKTIMLLTEIDEAELSDYRQ